MSDGDSWEQHRSLVEWRLETNEHRITEIDCKLDQVIETLGEIKGAKKTRQAVYAYVIPAVVAFLVVLVEQAVAAWWK